MATQTNVWLTEANISDTIVWPNVCQHFIKFNSGLKLIKICRDWREIWFLLDSQGVQLLIIN